HIIFARPRYLLHLHAHVVKKFARVRYRAANALANPRRRPGYGVAARFVVLHFYRLRGHKTLFTSRSAQPLAPSFRFRRRLICRCICALTGRQTLAGEEGFEPPYPVLETG